MNKIYDNAFRMGVLFNLLLFTALNLASFVIADIKHQAGKEIFFPDHGFVWGFPFDWSEKYFGVIEGAGTILNVIIWTVSGFAFGFLFKLVGSKISAPKAELK